MKGPWWAFVIGLGWLLNAVACIAINVPRIEGDVESRISRALKANALDDWKPRASGLDVTVAGPTLKNGDERDVNEEAVRELIEGVEGVRSVTVVYRRDGKSSGSDAREAWFQVTRIAGEEVILRGSFMNINDRDAVHEILEDWFGGLLVTNIADFTANSRPPYDVVRAVKEQVWMRKVHDFTLRVQDRTVTLEGTVTTPSEAATIATTVGKSFRLPVKNKLLVTTASWKPSPSNAPSTTLVSAGADGKAAPISNWAAFNRRESDVFSGNKLSEKGNAHFERIANFLKQDARLRLRIGVHTDEKGSLGETQSRAQAVKNFLLQRGIRAQRFQAIGFGARVPATSGFDRRVTFQTL